MWISSKRKLEPRNTTEDGGFGGEELEQSVGAEAATEAMGRGEQLDPCAEGEAKGCEGHKL